MNKCFERFYGRHLWNLGVLSNAMIPRCRPNLSFSFFSIVASIVYALIYPDEIREYRAPYHLKDDTIGPYLSCLDLFVKLFPVVIPGLGQVPGGGNEGIHKGKKENFGFLRYFQSDYWEL
jgi:hypothetical protein